jgi:hypothetical protein
MKFFETSAKDGTNVKESFSAIARDVAESLNLLPGSASTVPAGGAKKAPPAKKDCAIM